MTLPKIFAIAFLVSLFQIPAFASEIQPTSSASALGINQGTQSENALQYKPKKKKKSKSKKGGCEAYGR